MFGLFDYSPWIDVHVFKHDDTGTKRPHYLTQMKIHNKTNKKKFRTVRITTTTNCFELKDIQTKTMSHNLTDETK